MPLQVGAHAGLMVAASQQCCQQTAEHENLPAQVTAGLAAPAARRSAGRIRHHQPPETALCK